MTVNLCANFTIELFRELLERIHEVLERPLALANRSLKDQKQRSQALKEEINERRFLEDYFITIADLIVFYFLTLIFNRSNDRKAELVREIERKYTLICAWYEQMKTDQIVKAAFLTDLESVTFKLPEVNMNILNETAQNQKQTVKRKLPKATTTSLNVESSSGSDIGCVINQLITNVKRNFDLDVPLQADQRFLYTYDSICLNWSDLDEQASPAAGGLPAKRIERKCQQLENFLYTFKSLICTDKDSPRTIVDFCSGGGHLGILIAYMYPKCTVKLVENKEESLRMATRRIAKLKLTNCLLYKVGCKA